MFEDTLHKSESVRSSALYHKLKRNTLLKLNDPKFVYDLQVANVSSESHGWLQTLIDSTHVITFVVSIVVIIYGSFKSLNIDSNNQLLAANENKSQASSLDKKNPDSNESQLQQTQNIDSTHALLIPVAASISLLLMFFFFESIQTIFLVCTCILALITFSYLLQPACQLTLNFVCANHKICDKKYRCFLLGKFTLSEFFAQLLSFSLVCSWIITGHWLLMDIIGIGFCVTFIAIVRLPSLKVSCLLLIGLVIYDVFWVYFSHLIFDSNVMIKVATKEVNNPFKIIARRLNIPSNFSRELSLPGKLIVPSYQNAGNFSILGLGDIVVPGLLLCFVLRFDAYKRSQRMLSMRLVNNEQDASNEIPEKIIQQPHKLTCYCFDCDDLKKKYSKLQKPRHMSFPYFFVLCPYPSVRIPTANYTFSDFLRLDHISYFHCALVGYFVGLFAATFSSEVSHEAQPALLFLVPFTLVPLSLMAYMKGDLGLMWNEPFSYTVASKHLYV